MNMDMLHIVFIVLANVWNVKECTIVHIFFSPHFTCCFWPHNRNCLLIVNIYRNIMISIEFLAIIVREVWYSYHLHLPWTVWNRYLFELFDGVMIAMASHCFQAELLVIVLNLALIVVIHIARKLMENW